MGAAFVQAAHTANAASAASVAAAFGSSTVSTNTLVIEVSWSDVSFLAPSISDTGGNTWTAVTTVTNGTDNITTWYSVGCSGGPSTVTVTWTSGVTNRSLVINEYSGIHNFDLFAVGSGTSFGTVNISITPTSTGECGIEFGTGALGINVVSPYTGRVGSLHSITGDLLVMPGGTQNMPLLVTAGGCCSTVPEPWEGIGMAFVPGTLGGGVKDPHWMVRRRRGTRT